MRQIGEQEFLAWARQRGLDFENTVAESRFWNVPEEPQRRPYFIKALLQLFGERESCLAWRQLGSWPASADAGRINDVVEWQILKGLGLPLGTNDVVQFSESEM